MRAKSRGSHVSAVRGVWGPGCRAVQETGGDTVESVRNQRAPSKPEFGLKAAGATNDSYMIC